MSGSFLSRLNRLECCLPGCRGRCPHTVILTDRVTWEGDPDVLAGEPGEEPERPICEACGVPIGELILITEVVVNSRRDVAEYREAVRRIEGKQ